VGVPVTLVLDLRDLVTLRYALLDSYNHSRGVRDECVAHFPEGVENMDEILEKKELVMEHLEQQIRGSR
jgi:hypothetical protein